MAFFKVMFAEGQTCIWACMKFDRLFQLSAALKHKTAPWCRLLSAVLFCLPDITQVEVWCTWAGWVYKSARPDLLPLLLILCFCLFNMHTIIQTADRHVIVHIRYLKSGPWEKCSKNTTSFAKTTVYNSVFYFFRIKKTWNQLQYTLQRSSGDEECIIVRFHRAECIE